MLKLFFLLLIVGYSEMDLIRNQTSTNKPEVLTKKMSEQNSPRIFDVIIVEWCLIFVKWILRTRVIFSGTVSNIL